MRRRIVVAHGSLTAVVLADGLPIRLDQHARSIAFLDGSLALVVFDGGPSDRNLLVLGSTGQELARLGTTCGTGTISEVLDVAGEIRVIEATPAGDYQARLDLETFDLERVGGWR